MKKESLLIMAALCLKIGDVFSQTDVTSQYIPNAGFEECEPLPTVVYHDNQKNIDINKIEVWSHWNTAKGTDYESTGWKLVEQMKNANGGVVVYGVNIQSGQYATAGEPGPAQGITGTKGLCFCGAAGLVYQQANEITLPAGTYRLTVNLYARNGQTSNPGPTQEVNNIKTGFMPTGGTEDDLIPAKRDRKQFASNAWDTEVLDIELTQPTKGRFQISYGSSYYVVVDDIKLEYQGGVVTTELAKVITKAKALNAELNNSDLSSAISAAETFIADPTNQDDVTTQVETLYTAMSTALSATTEPVNITAAYLENASFETGKIEPWAWSTATGIVGTPINTESMPYIDGQNIVEYTTNGSNGFTQTITHLPAGYYAVDAKLNKKAFLKIGTSNTYLTGGTDPLFLRVHPNIYNASSTGDLTVAAQASTGFRIDNFRLFYGKDEASLIARLLQDVKADAQAILEMTEFGDITGEERLTLISAVGGNDIDAINTAANAFVAAKEAFAELEKAKAAAAVYTKEDYPYGSDNIFQEIQELLKTQPFNATDATNMKKELETACFNFYVSNAYCEGVARTDYTANILGANATADATGWGVKNMTIRTDKAGWKNPKTNETDKVVYGVTSEWYQTNGTTKEASILKQVLNGLPAGDYVLSMTMMGSTNLEVYVFFNAELIGMARTIGTSGGGKYGAGWNDYVFHFTKADNTDMPLQLQCKPETNYKDWYVDNFRLYLLNNGTVGIQTVSPETTSSDAVYDLQGRRVAQPGKGLYIINNKKVFIK